MKQSIINPLFKNNDNKNIINYRPIALFHKLVKHLKKLYIINKNKYGFIPKYNTKMLLLNIQHFILQKNSENKKI